MKDLTVFDAPEEYAVSQDVKNPDTYLNKLIADFPANSQTRKKIETIKLLSHNDKVAWLLGLKTHEEGAVDTKMEPASGCVIVIITVVVAVVVGYVVVNGVQKPVIEHQERQKKVKQCAGDRN